MLGSIDADSGLGAAFRAEETFPFANESAANTGISAGIVFTNGPLVFIRDAFFENHFLCNGFIVFFLGQVTLCQHFA